MDVEFEQDLNTLWGLLFAIVYDAERRLSAHIAQHGLTQPQFYVLKTLSDHGGTCPIGQIARQHHLTNATMTGLIKRMEAMNPPLVIREQSADDRRSVMVSLTPAGEQRYLALQHSLLEQLRILLNLVDVQERKQALQYLMRFVTLLQTHFPVEFQVDAVES